MHDYMISIDENGSPYLAHYGVLGMKWGVRRNPQRAYERASKKRDKLNRKAEKREHKAKVMTAHSPRRSMRWNDIGIARYDKKMRQINDANARAARSRLKAERWMKAMEKTFANIPLSELKQQ